MDCSISVTLPDISYCFLIHPIDKTEWDISRFADWVKNTRPTANIDESLEDACLTKFSRTHNLDTLRTQPQFWTIMAE